RKTINRKEITIMPNWPDYTAEFETEDLEDEPREIELLPIFSGEKFRRLTSYPMIVEMWEKKRAGNGRITRAWLATFNEKERAILGRWHTKFYRWYLVTGTPRRVMLKPKTLALILCCTEFFGTI